MGQWIESMWEWVLGFWGSGLSQIQTLLTASPLTWLNGSVWSTVQTIYGTVQGIAYGLIIAFFYMGMIKTGIRLTDLKRPEVVISAFLRFLIVKALIDWGLDLLIVLISFGQKVTAGVFQAGSINIEAITMPENVLNGLKSASFFQKVLLLFVSLPAIFVILIQTVMIVLFVFGRFFKIYVVAAFGPLPMAALAGEPTQSIGWRYLKLFAGFCLEGIVISIACTLYTVIITNISFPSVADGETLVMLLTYMVNVIFQTFLLTGMVKGADNLVARIMG